MSLMKYCRLIFLFCFIACNQDNNMPNRGFELSKNEDRGIKDILENYGGICKYYVGEKKGLDEKKIFFEIELSQSKSVEKNKESPGIPASNMAYLFYRNLLSGANKYDEIRCTVIFNDGLKRTFNYPIKDLEIVKVRMQNVYEIVNYLKEKKNDEITKAFKLDNSDLRASINKLKKLENTSTPIKEFLPYSFSISNDKSKINISGAIIRETTYDEINIEFSTDVTSTKIYDIGYYTW